MATWSHIKLNWKPQPVKQVVGHVRLRANQTTLSLPSKVDLETFCSPVKNQKDIGSCVSFAVNGLVEFIANTNGLKGDFAERLLYYTTRVNIEHQHPEDDNGCYIHNAIKALTEYGNPTESIWEYDNWPEELYYIKNKLKWLTETPTEQMYNEATKCQAIETAAVSPNPKALRILLAKGIPVVFGFPTNDDVFRGNGETGILRAPDDPAVYNTMTEGHAVLFVGYDDTNELFKFKNSWSDKWGDKGYGYLPYQYPRQDGWTIYATEFANDKVIRLLQVNNLPNGLEVDVMSSNPISKSAVI